LILFGFQKKPGDQVLEISSKDEGFCQGFDEWRFICCRKAIRVGGRGKKRGKEMGRGENQFPLSP
jgi:hypothetical protein